MDTTSHVLLPSGGNHGYYKSRFIAIWWQSGILQDKFCWHLVTIMDTTSHVYWHLVAIMDTTSQVVLPSGGNHVLSWAFWC